MELTLDYSELCALLVEAGVNAPAGMDVTSFPAVNDSSRQEILAAGRSELSVRQDGPAQGLVQVLARPTAVLHVTRWQENKIEQDFWFFHTSVQTVRLHKKAAEQYTLTTVSGETAVLEQIQQFLPLQTVQPSLTYRITVDEEEFENLRDLASEWEEVPSLATLEADGLELVAAKDLFDSAVEPQWRGVVEFMRLHGNDIVHTYTVRALQGQEVAWLVRPYAADPRKVLIETAQAGELQKALESSWRLVASA